jgi:hypothetical protein
MAEMFEAAKENEARQATQASKVAAGEESRRELTKQIKELSIELKNSQAELEATVKARGEEQKEQPGVLLACKQQAEQERDNAKAEVEKEQRKLESLQLELEAEKEETAKYKAQAKIEASELAKSHAEKYKEMLRNTHLESASYNYQRHIWMPPKAV